MKKIKNAIVLFVIFCLIYSLSGCAILLAPRKTNEIEKIDISNVESSDLVEDDHTMDNSNSTESSVINENTSSKDSSSKPSVETSILIKTEYYNLSLPHSWKGKYHYEIYNHDANEFGYSISFYNKKNRDIGCGGHLFTIILTDDSDYSGFANGGKIGEMKMEKTNYLFVRYPSDVQFGFDYMNEYNTMRNDIDNIIRSISSNKKNVTVKITN